MSSQSSKRSSMILYAYESDIHSHRVRIVLAEKGVAFDQITVNPNAPTADLMEINPSLVMPTLVDRELVIYTSEIIMEYLDERFPHPPLMPVYPVARARCRLMMNRVNTDWYRLLPEIQKGSKQAKKDLADSLVSISPLLEETPFFMTDEFTLVDCCVAPLFLRLEQWKIDIPPQAKGLLNYIKKIFKRESFVQSLTPLEQTWLSASLAKIDN